MVINAKEKIIVGSVDGGAGVWCIMDVFSFLFFGGAPMWCSGLDGSGRLNIRTCYWCEEMRELRVSQEQRPEVECLLGMFEK